MLVKMGVDVSRLKPPIRKKLKEIDAIFVYHTGQEAVISSTYEGDHGANSIHYGDFAIDFRGRGLAQDVIDKIIQAIRAICPKGLYDVLFHNGHFHLEYDPKS